MHISHNTQGQEGPSVVVLGCGNSLLGDDGFGPAVVERLLADGLPKGVQAIDVGTGVREVLLDYLLLPAARPSLLLVVDAEPNREGAVGAVRISSPEAVAACKIHDFSLHQFPTVNLLRELADATQITVLLVLVRTSDQPPVFGAGLSPPIRAAVGTACALITGCLTTRTSAEGCLP